MGVFDPVIRKINYMLECMHIPQETVLIDAGCGEGFYTRNITFEGCKQSIGFDLSKDAIQYASKKDENAFYMVADLANIPLKDNIAGVILDVFTPANYKEFKRILNTEGILVKVVPKEKYLIELRKLAAPFLVNKQYDSGGVEDYTEKNVDIILKERVNYKIEITPEEAIKIAQMTPMFNNIDIMKIDFSKTCFITIDEEIIIGSIL
jgi:Methyltransferase domain.